MRVKQSIKNSVSSAVCFFISTIIGLFAQKVFLNTLGTETLGLNGLYNNIMTMLAISELGIGSAIICNLYKPVADNNKEQIKALLNFYKKSYYIIISVIAVLSIIILPFLHLIVGNTGIQINIYFIFAFYVVDTICSYLLSYKRSILYATQENYIINFVHLGYIIILNVLQIVILLWTSNFIFYLIIKIITRILENLIITLIVNKKYSYLKEKNNKTIDSNMKKNIIEKIKGLFLHKIGAFIVMGTDNILISSLFGVSFVGLYYNYNIIIGAVNNLITQFLTATTSSVGNLLVTENTEKVFDTYKNMNFINYTFAIISSVLLLNLIQPFIVLWVGKEYLLEPFVVIVLVISFYLTIMRRTINIFKEAAGIFYEDKFVPIIESIINLICSIVLGKIYGLVGIFLGTILSTLFLFLYDFPKYGYNLLFKRKTAEFIIDFLQYLLLTIIIIIINYYIMNFIVLSNVIIELLIKAILTLIINGIILCVIFYKKPEFKYQMYLVKNIMKRKKNKI